MTKFLSALRHLLKDTSVILVYLLKTIFYSIAYLVIAYLPGVADGWDRAREGMKKLKTGEWKTPENLARCKKAASYAEAIIMFLLMGYGTMKLYGVTLGKVLDWLPAFLMNGIGLAIALLAIRVMFRAILGKNDSLAVIGNKLLNLVSYVVTAAAVVNLVKNGFTSSSLSVLATCGIGLYGYHTVRKLPVFSKIM